MFSFRHTSLEVLEVEMKGVIEVVVETKTTLGIRANSGVLIGDGGVETGLWEL